MSLFDLDYTAKILTAKSFVHFPLLSFFWLWDIDDESSDENQRINKNEKL